MPLPIVAVKPFCFTSGQVKEIFDSVQVATLSVFNTDGGMKLDNVVVMTEQVVSKHDWSIHVRITLKRAFFENASKDDLVKLRERFVNALCQSLAEKSIKMTDGEVKAMIELIDRY